ncbi:MAG: glutamine--fructose-6-phosphate transaminase (isomerizing), partial [Nanoarchaeota archaeon]|nr:glutamine--fructose-6-phosphate transaminase (isomerizing) [Nanoarchaeota archaeon]
MCGIIGYIGNENCIPILMKGLKRLEYRGYDSIGFSIVKNNEIKTFKQKGEIKDFNVSEIYSNLGIGHTRWSTHGEPSDINAHPHNDCENKISIVHNGIVENFESLKKVLINKGHKFKSETDSEVLAHLIEEFYEGDLTKSVKKALVEIKGTYGLLVVKNDENKIVAARKGSPLVFGIKKGGYFISSDASAIIEHTKDVIYLVDEDVLEINKDNYALSNLKDPNIIDREIERLEWDLEKIEKKGFKHFMLKEIYEQPESIKNVLRGRIKDGEIKITIDFDKVFIKNLKRIVIVGCGTSWHSALIGKQIIEKNCKISVEVDYASEFRYRNPLVNKNDLVVVISQSGETADTLAALRESKKKGAKTIGIVNVVGSTIARECGEGIYLHAGPEIGVASTKAFTSQIMALIILSLFFNKNKEIIEELEKLSDFVKKILDDGNIKKIAEIYYKKNNFLYLGRGINFPVALEGALKLKEISYIHAEGYPAAEMKHGPIALIDEDMPVVVIAKKNGVYDKILSNIQEIKARKGKLIAIADENDLDIKNKVDHVIYVPKTIEELEPIVNVIPLQLLAYYIADLRGCNPDKPRNLAKSVTVE